VPSVDIIADVSGTVVRSLTRYTSSQHVGCSDIRWRRLPTVGEPSPRVMMGPLRSLEMCVKYYCRLRIHIFALQTPETHIHHASCAYFSRLDHGVEASWILRADWNRRPHCRYRSCWLGCCSRMHAQRTQRACLGEKCGHQHSW
jgi:hypothetical protein